MEPPLADVPPLPHLSREQTVGLLKEGLLTKKKTSNRVSE